MFSKSIVLFMLIFIGVTSRRSSQFYFIQVVRFGCSGYHFHLSILCVVSLYECHKNSVENFRTTGDWTRDCTRSIALELHAILVGNVADWSFHITGSKAVFKCQNT